MVGFIRIYKDGFLCTEMILEVFFKKVNWCLCRGLSLVVIDRRACRFFRLEYW